MQFGPPLPGDGFHEAMGAANPPLYVFAVPLAAVVFDIYCLFKLNEAPEV